MLACAIVAGVRPTYFFTYTAIPDSFSSSGEERPATSFLCLGADRYSILPASLIIACVTLARALPCRLPPE